MSPTRASTSAVSTRRSTTIRGNSFNIGNDLATTVAASETFDGLHQQEAPCLQHVCMRLPVLGSSFLYLLAVHSMDVLNPRNSLCLVKKKKNSQRWPAASIIKCGVNPWLSAGVWSSTRKLWCEATSQLQVLKKLCRKGKEIEIWKACRTDKIYMSILSRKLN